MTLSPGSHIGRYQILAPLGAGGMGQVFRACDVKLGREVAIKIVAPELAKDLNALVQFEREARAVAALSHPNIVALYDLATEGNVTFAVMELLDGETLRDRLARGPLPWRQAVEIGARIADGLAAAHSKRIVHRDVKPGNVFLTAGGGVKVLDFGLARHRLLAPDRIDSLAGTETDAGILSGTFGYMAPEQLRSEPATAVSDVFALGAVLYEMVAGRRAFSGRTSVETLAATLTDQPPPLSEVVDGVPPDLDRWVSHCLEKKPADRLQSVRDLAFALRALLEAPARSGREEARGRTGRIESLAVLPFVTAGDSADQEYLSDGVTESLINSLAQLPGLRVMARSAVYRHRGRDIDPIQIGRDLSVGAIMTGRVFQRGDTLVVAAELVDVANGLHLWGQQYKRKLADIFEIQDEIATEISEKLRLRLSGEDQKRLTRRYTEDPAAYQLYLMGRHCWNQRTEDGMRKAAEYFEQAVARDNRYARAYTGLADAYAMLSIYQALAPKDGFMKAKEAQQRALEIDNELAEGYASLGFTHLFYDWDRVAAAQSLRKAIELNPGYASAHQWYALCFALTGQIVESIREMTIAQQLDPFSASINVTGSYVLYWTRRYDEAVERLRAAVDLHPTFWQPYYFLGLSLEQNGRLYEAIELLEKSRALGDTPWRLGGLGHAYALAGDRDRAQRLIKELIELSKHRYVSPLNVATILCALDPEAAFEWFERALEDRSFLMAYLEVDPVFDGCRGHPRFHDLVRRLWKT